MDEAKSMDDVELMGLLLRLAHAHVARAETALAGLRGRGRGQFVADRVVDLEAIRARLNKAATVRATEGTLDLAHGLMREVEQAHDAILAAQAAVDAEMERWKRTVGEV